MRTADCAPGPSPAPVSQTASAPSAPTQVGYREVHFLTSLILPSLRLHGLVTEKYMPYTFLPLPSLHGYILKYIHFIHTVLRPLIPPSLCLHRLVIEKYMSYTSLLLPSLRLHRLVIEQYMSYTFLTSSLCAPT